MSRYLAKLCLAGVAALALLALGGTSILAPAWAAPPDKSTLGKLGCNSGQIARKDGTNSWICDSEDFNELKNVPAGLADGDDDTLDDLSCTQGQTVIFDVTLGWMCADVGAAVPQAVIDNLELLISVPASAFVFVTSGSYTGDLVQEAIDLGLGDFTPTGTDMSPTEAGDAICNKLAQEANLPGEYLAWLTWFDGPEDYFDQVSGPYVFPSVAVIVADDWADLTDGALHVPINVDENGVAVLSSNVWTGGSWSGGGGFGNPSSCFNWQSSSVSDTGLIGLTTENDGNWSADSSLDNDTCDSFNRLYCFGQFL